jgi:hypothetical protein
MQAIRFMQFTGNSCNILSYGRYNDLRRNGIEYRDNIKMKKLSLKYGFIISILSISPVHSATLDTGSFAVPADNAAYADIADLVTTSPLIIDAKVRKTTKIPAAQAIGVPQNLQRLLVEADVMALIRGLNGAPARVRFVLDVPKDERGHIPKLKKQRFFILGDNVKGRPDQVRLSRPDSLIQYSAPNDAMLRSITKEAVMLDAPQKITGVVSAFYSPGTVIGEGNTQIFLRTQNNQPFTISVASAPGQPKHWSVSTSELIEETTAVPHRYTLLWYRLACGLPKALPSELVESGDGENATLAQDDYNAVINALGPCGRTR